MLNGETSPFLALPIAGAILKQDLLSASALDDLIAEASPRVAYGPNLAGEVVDLHLDAVPAARLGLPAVGHGLACPSSVGLVQQEAQVASREDRETGGGVKLDTEAEPPGVERDRLLDVINYVTHTDRGHRYCLSSLGLPASSLRPSMFLSPPNFVWGIQVKTHRRGSRS